MIESQLATTLDPTAPNCSALNSLSRAIASTQRRFSLVLAHSNSADIRNQSIQILQRNTLRGLSTLHFSPDSESLYQTIQQYCVNELPSSLMILGLDTAEKLDTVLVSANFMRNEFRRQFQFPLVLWVNDEVLVKLIRLAPDFYTWSGSPIYCDRA